MPQSTINIEGQATMPEVHLRRAACVRHAQPVDLALITVAERPHKAKPFSTLSPQA